MLDPAFSVFYACPGNCIVSAAPESPVPCTVGDYIACNVMRFTDANETLAAPGLRMTITAPPYAHSSSYVVAGMPSRRGAIVVSTQTSLIKSELYITLAVTLLGMLVGNAVALFIILRRS